MSTRYLTASELGRLVGVSRQAVAEARRKEIIKPNTEGLFDILDPDIEQWIAKRPYQRVQAVRKTARDAQGAAAATSEDATDEKDLDELDALEERKASARYRSTRGSSKDDPSYAESERKLKAAQASYWEDRAAKARGDLISRDLVDAFLNKLWQIDQSHFITRGDRISASIVALVRSTTGDAEAEIAVNRVLTDDAYEEQRFKKGEIEKYLQIINGKLEAAK